MLSTPGQAHKPVIMLVTVSGEPSQQETDDLTLLWEMGLQNNHIEVTRYPIEQDRVMLQVQIFPRETQNI